jgi:hypothetical protein
LLKGFIHFLHLHCHDRRKLQKNQILVSLHSESKQPRMHWQMGFYLQYSLIA